MFCGFCLWFGCCGVDVVNSVVYFTYVYVVCHFTFGCLFKRWFVLVLTFDFVGLIVVCWFCGVIICVMILWLFDCGLRVCVGWLDCCWLGLFWTLLVF